MKKILSSIAILFSLILFVNAQNTAPYWSLAGNSNAAASPGLGTTNLFPLKLFTNNVERMRIDSIGRVGIGLTKPVNILTVKSSGGIPSTSWLTGLNSPIFVGFADNISTEHVLATASNITTRRPIFHGRRARGTLTAPAAVATNDYLNSVLASGYDGTAFQNPATIDFFVDGTPTAGNVPARISFVTGSNSGNRAERLKVGSTGNFNFNGDQLTITQATGNVGIGTAATAAKLEVRNTAATGSAIYARGANYGLQASSSDIFGYGVYGSSLHIGVYGQGGSYGVYGHADYYIGVYGAGNEHGTYGFSAPGIGAFGQSTSGIGVYGQSSAGYGGQFYSNNSYGIIATTANGTYAGVFEGSVLTSGTYNYSDKNLKKDIHEFKNAMTIINKLKPRDYEYKNEGEYASLHLPKGRHYGLLAQDLELVLPNLVSEAAHELRNNKPLPPVKPTADGKPSPAVIPKKETGESITIKAVNYTELISIIIKAMQEQDATIQKQSEKIDELTQLVNKLTLNATASGAVKLSGAFLGQCTPNPNSKNARISYSLPGSFSKAELVIKNELGQKVKYMQLNKNGLVEIDTSGLAAGTYFYSLFVNGTSVDTKKMVVSR